MEPYSVNSCRKKISIYLYHKVNYNFIESKNKKEYINSYLKVKIKFQLYILFYFFFFFNHLVVLVLLIESNIYFLCNI